MTVALRSQKSGQLCKDLEGAAQRDGKSSRWVWVRTRRPAWLELRVAGLEGSLVRSLDFLPLAVEAIKVFRAVTGSSSSLENISLAAVSSKGWVK